MLGHTNSRVVGVVLGAGVTSLSLIRRQDVRSAERDIP